MRDGTPGDLEAGRPSIAAIVSGWTGVVAPHIFLIGQNTVDFFISLFAVLYITFFLFRDGRTLIG